MLDDPVRTVLASSDTALSHDANYLVLPGPAISALPAALQQQLAHVIAYIQTATEHWPWPRYTVRPEVAARVVDLTPQQRTRAGISLVYDSQGGARFHRIATGAEITAPERAHVRVPYPDPLLDMTT